MTSTQLRTAAIFIVLCVAHCYALHNTVPYQIAVVHRHGARSPLLSSSNKSHLCPWYGCGVLNKEGKDMLYHLGLALREKFNQTLQPSNYYDPDLFHSSSTDIPRTMQSGAAMLRGLFADLEGTSERVYPVLHTRPLDEDERLLVWTGWPSVVLEYAGVMPYFIKMMQNTTNSVLTNETLQKIGIEIGLGEECTVPTDPFQCALDAQDFLNCMTSMGLAGPYPYTAAHKDALDYVLEMYNANSMWGYDNEYQHGEFQFQVGTLGYKLAEHIVSRAKPNPDVPTMEVLQHYSGHDTTLMPLWMTLGNDSLVNPVFGQAMVFAFSGDPTTGDITISAEIGAPGQLPSNHSYTFEPYSLQCITAAWQRYNSSSCPLADFERFLTTRGPWSPLGICYASDWMLEAVSCLPSQPATTGPCKAFRTACLTACGEGRAMTGNLTCIPYL